MDDKQKPDGVVPAYSDVTVVREYVDLGAYVSSVTRRRHSEGALHFQWDLLSKALKTSGGTSISVADILKPHQFHSPLYFSITTPRNQREVPHWHTIQVEAYTIMAGEAEMTFKWRDDPDGWKTCTAKAGDKLIVQPDTCHWFKWKPDCDDGVAYVDKAPQAAGVGPFPAGKVVCQDCPHNPNNPETRGECVFPSGWIPPVSA